MTKFKILVCVTNSESSRVAFKFACSRAKSLGVPLEVLHILDDTSLQNPFVSETSRQQEAHKAATLLGDYTRLADSEWPGLKLNCTYKIGMFEDLISKTIGGDSEIGMLVLGYSMESNTGNHHASSLLSRLGRSLMIPITIVPGNMTNQQIAELSDDKY